MKSLSWVDYFVGGAFALFAVIVTVPPLVNRVVRRRHIKRQFAQWTAIAQPLGFHAELSEYGVTIHGTVASRPFELDYGNSDGELGMRVSVEDKDARLHVLPHKTSPAQSRGSRQMDLAYGEIQAPLGDAEFDAVFYIRANRSGQALLPRLGPSARRVLLDFPELEIHQGGGTLWIRFDYGELQASRIMAARQLLASLIGEP